MLALNALLTFFQQSTPSFSFLRSLFFYVRTLAFVQICIQSRSSARERLPVVVIVCSRLMNKGAHDARVLDCDS